MNAEKTAQLLSWLDEEHRRDKNVMSDIAAQLDQIRTQTTGLSKGLQDLEERLARVQSQSLRYSQIEQALAQVKTEVTLLFEQFNQRVQQREDEAFKVRQRERERLDRVVAELGERIEQVANQIPPFASDHDAIKRLDSAQLTMIQALEELTKRLEATNARVGISEEWIKRTGALISEIQQVAERLRQDRSDGLEAMRRADQMRARQIIEWNEQMKAMHREMEQWAAPVQVANDIAKEVRAQLALLEGLDSELKHAEASLVQRQKLTEEFSRGEIAAAKAELEKRWSQQQHDWEFMRDEWSKRLAGSGLRIDQIEEWRGTVAEDFHQIRERMEADRQRWLEVLVDVVHMMNDHQRATNSRSEALTSDLIKRVETEQAASKAKTPPARPAPEA